jgi:AcrR family transcriptional regulator
MVSFRAQIDTQSAPPKKRERTRLRLMDAAATVMAEKGIEAASIHEITIRADVANGTFYNHFQDKNDILLTVATHIANDIARQIDFAMDNMDDGAQRVAFASRQMVELASENLVWGQALLESIAHIPSMRRDVSTYLRGDIERGIAQGTFKVELDDFLVDVCVSLMTTAIHHRLKDGPTSDAGTQITEYLLRTLGVSPAKAAKIAHTTLPKLSLTPDLQAQPKNPQKK